MSFEHLRSLLPEEDFLLPSSALYAIESSTWSLAKQRHPRLVIRPANVETLAACIKYLASTDLHWKVRSQGFGSSSADDVLVSLTAFDGFTYHKENEEEAVVIAGAGQSWGEFYQKQEEASPGWSVVGARTPAIGLGGSTLCGGFSWMSGEYGCISDPQNLLDAQIVKVDGSILWASEDPDLLWAIRGTQGAFGVATAFKYRSRRHTESIWSGPIFLPRSDMKEVVKGVVAMDNPRTSLKIAMFCYLMQKDKLKFIGAEEDCLVIHVVDGEGEAHGRSPEGFQWALNLTGAVDKTRVTNIRGVAAMQEHIRQIKGTGKAYWYPLGLPNLTEDIMLNAFDWHTEVSNEKSSVGDNAYLLFELFSVNKHLGDNSESGWPRPNYFRHTILMGAGCAPDGSKEEEETAQRLLKAGPRKVIGVDAKIDIPPTGMEEFHPLTSIFGDHLPQLRELKRRYDPTNRLNSMITAS